jgi:cytochrome P450
MSSSDVVTEFPDFAPTPDRPAYFDENLNAWQVFGYRQVQRVLSDFATFSSNRHALDPNDTAATGSDSLNDLDPPRHRQLRALVAGAFTPRVVSRLEGWVRELSDELLEAVADRGEMDIVGEFAHQLPLRVIGRLVGFPDEDLEQLREWGQMSGNVRSPDALRGQELMADYFSRLIAARTRDPREDLLTALIASEVDGARLSQPEIIAFCPLLLTAGTHTLRDLIGNAWLCFDRHPEALADLRADPSLIPGAIEEVLRYLPPVPQFPRVAAADTEIDGSQVTAGQWIMARIPSANRDAADFERPNEFDIRRQPNRHLTLGYGIHFCLGAGLARTEAKIALETMLRRLHDVRIVPGTTPTPHPSPFAYGMEELPVTFTPA